tara:strand:+ start:1164 stop:2153 length:990 start_codon:yes stop_codon:yes gene_type:complete
MKNKSYSKNKSNNFMKLISILILLGVTLYFSFSNISIISENFDYSTYTNLCKDKPTKFYLGNSDSQSIENHLLNDVIDDSNYDPTTNSCGHKCKNHDECNLYIYNESTTNTDNNDNTVNNDICKLYSFKEGDKIYVNCDNKYIDSSDDRKGTYMGEGLVKTNYYEKNKQDFSYNNYILDKFIDIKSKLLTIDREDNYESNINTYNEIIDDDFKKLESHLDLCLNKIYSDKTYDECNKINFLGKSEDKFEIQRKFLNIGENKEKNNALLINNNLAFTKISFIYTILAIILLISIILVVIYKLVPNYLNEFMLLIYFVSILFIVFFIHILL